MAHPFVFRYKEQKQRMIQCGLEHKWYLIEDFTKHVKHWHKKDTAVVGGPGFSHKALESAIAGTAALPG